MLPKSISNMQGGVEMTENFISELTNAFGKGYQLHKTEVFKQLEGIMFQVVYIMCIFVV